LRVAMLYVEKDLSQCVKVMLDKWDSHRESMNYEYFYVSNCRLSPREFKTAIEKSTNPPAFRMLMASNREKVQLYGVADDGGPRSGRHVYTLQFSRDVRLKDHPGSKLVGIGC
jgi:hypothetical protein